MYIICHYNEIGLKGGNRKFFEEKLIKNLKIALNKDFFKLVKRISGRIIVELTDLGEKNQEEIKIKLKKVFGLANFSFAELTEQKIEAIKRQVFVLIKNKDFKTFRVSSQRSKKDFNLNSLEIDKEIGVFVLEKFRDKKVDLRNPDLEIFIEIVENFAFIYLEKNPGLGGLPIGVGGRGLVLLSGGIDSPVAAWQMMKRGMEVIFVHFYAYANDEEKSLEKIKKMVESLNQYQLNSKLYLIPFRQFQEKILTNNKYCCLCCKRLMFRISQIIAKKENCQTLITGDNLGQVASQTIENIGVVEKIVDLPVLRPLIGFDKLEIIKIAKEIGTYEISCLPVEFYCQKFLPRHPATKAKLLRVEEVEKKLEIGKMVEEVIKNLTFLKILLIFSQKKEVCQCQSCPPLLKGHF